MTGREHPRATALDGSAEPITAPELARWQVVLLAASLVLAILFLVDQADGIGNALDALADADRGWIVLSFGALVLSFVARAVSYEAAARGPGVLKSSLVQVVMIFAGAITPAGSGMMVTRIRAYYKAGLSTRAAVEVSVATAIAAAALQGVVLLLAIIRAARSLSASEIDLGPVVETLGIIAGILAVALIGVPVLRRWIGRQARETVGNLRALSPGPARTVLFLASTCVAILLPPLSLLLSVKAFGIDIAFGTAILSVFGASLVSTVVPIPGGVGVQEASITAMLQLSGVPGAEALAAAVLYRIISSYLWVLPGWLLSRPLIRRNVL